MYNDFYGLSKKPFNMTPDPAFLFLTKQHREALAGLTYAILDRKGFVLLSGVAGSGKTTLLSWILQKLPVSRIQSSVILNPTLTAGEFLEMALLDFGLTEIPASKAQRLWALQKLLLKGKAEGRVNVLIVDEAHKLSGELLEEVRLLGNFENADEKLLQILLIGQSELDEILARPELFQLKQRISVRLSLDPLSSGEVGHYMAHRWRVAGGKNPPFTELAAARVAGLSRGIPRLINSLCDNALIQAFAEESRAVTAEHVETAAQDLLLAEAKPKPRPKPPEAPVPVVSPPPALRTISGYAAASRKQSFLGRWAGKLGLAS